MTFKRLNVNLGTEKIFQCKKAIEIFEIVIPTNEKLKEPFKGLPYIIILSYTSHKHKPNRSSSPHLEITATSLDRELARKALCYAVSAEVDLKDKQVECKVISSVKRPKLSIVTAAGNYLLYNCLFTLGLRFHFTRISLIGVHGSCDCIRFFNQQMSYGATAVSLTNKISSRIEPALYMSGDL